MNLFIKNSIAKNKFDVILTPLFIAETPLPGEQPRMTGAGFRWSLAPLQSAASEVQGQTSNQDFL
jgi:hypothetical protein